MVLSRALLLMIGLTLAGSALAAPRKPAAPAAPSNNDQAMAAVESARQSHYVIREAPADGLRLEPPTLPDLSPYTAAAAKAKVGKRAKGRVSVRRMVEVQMLEEFVGGNNRLREWATRQAQNPLAIIIEGGLVTPADIAAALPAQQFEETAPGVFVARLPVAVAQNASLLVDAATKELRLSEEKGAFLVNDGEMFLFDTRLLAWRERENGPARYIEDKRFRPFLVSWGGATLYVVDSHVESLGYETSKSYGLSVSQYSPNLQARIKRPPPKAWIIGSSFVDMLYGFYCYEAEDLPIIGNTYRDNIVYGIDPHDRSHRLIIANNLVHGTRKKHGIIVSREVNDSWIFGNTTWDNKLSGIVIDRASARNIVANNLVHSNHADGITIYESPDNLLWGNHVIGNAKHGIRVRNSMQIRLHENHASANQLSGIYGHIKDLRGTDRDLRLDPFEQNVSMVIVGGELVHNLSAPFSIDRPLSVELYDVDLLAPARSGGIRLSGVLGEHQNQLLDLLVRQRVPVIIEPAGGAGRTGSKG